MLDFEFWFDGERFGFGWEDEEYFIRLKINWEVDGKYYGIL